jgi:hypothetical protein
MMARFAVEFGMSLDRSYHASARRVFDILSSVICILLLSPNVGLMPDRAFMGDRTLSLLSK